VNKARDILTNRDVAIKTILDQDSMEPKLFRYLEHPNIIRNLNTFNIDNKTYMVMEYHPLTLNNYLKYNNLRNQEDKLKPLFRQLCRAIEHIHMQGIVHRDIKL
jgi:serine/threonine protein kinase